MRTIQIFLENITNNNITFLTFDLNLYKKISKKDQQLSHIDTQSKIRYTIYFNDEPCGFIGAIPHENYAFVQIVILPKYRGKGILELSYKELIKKYKFKTLFATIYKSNIQSIKAHMKIGFKELSKKELDHLITIRKISRYQTRLFKKY